MLQLPSLLHGCPFSSSLRVSILSLVSKWRPWHRQTRMSPVHAALPCMCPPKGLSILPLLIGWRRRLAGAPERLPHSHSYCIPACQHFSNSQNGHSTCEHLQKLLSFPGSSTYLCQSDTNILYSCQPTTGRHLLEFTTACGSAFKCHEPLSQGLPLLPFSFVLSVSKHSHSPPASHCLNHIFCLW